MQIKINSLGLASQQASKKKDEILNLFVIVRIHRILNYTMARRYRPSSLS